MDNTNTAINNANKTAAQRANEAVGVSTNTLEATPVKLNLPQPAPVVPDLPIYSFTQASPEEQARQSQLRRGQQGNLMNLDQLYANMADLGTRGEFTQRAEEEAGIPQLNTQLTEIENELMQKSLAFRREQERIQTTGGTKAQVATILAEVGRKQNQELADLEVIRAARSNTLTNAQNLVNRKVELEFADKQAQIDALKFIYDENKEVLNKEDDRLFQRAIAREDRGFEIAKQQYAQTEAEKMRYVANAAQAGADNNTLKAIQGARSLNELYSLPGIQNFALSKAEKLDMAYKQAQIDSVYDTINNRGIEEYNARIEAAEKLAEGNKSATEKALAVSALATELQSASGLDAAIGFGIKKSALARTGAGAATGAAVGAGLGSVVPFAGTAIGGIAGGIIGGVTGALSGSGAVAGTSRADYEAKAAKLSSMLTLENLDLMSGPLTDTDVRILQQAATVLNDRNVSEETWISALNEATGAAERIVRNLGLDEEQQQFWGRTADGMPISAQLNVDPSTGNITVPSMNTSTPIISNQEFFNR